MTNRYDKQTNKHLIGGQNGHDNREMLTKRKEKRNRSQKDDKRKTRRKREEKENHKFEWKYGDYKTADKKTKEGIKHGEKKD